MAQPLSNDDVIFNVVTPLGFSVRATTGYWRIITTIKHPVMQGRETAVKDALSNPDVVRLSKSDPQIYLFYRFDGAKRWVCAVARRLNGDGFLITAYRTSNVKEGRQIWPK
ncbi:MAG: DUF4258 domain-containing protein [Chloroflexi bacterium]|nr:DUF4258 domain-containing protein [Chloroflexota bacterium]